MAKLYKVWIEIKEYADETGDGVSRDDLSFVLPFFDSATCEKPSQAIRIAQEMHAAVNQGFEVDEEVIAKVAAADD